MPITTAMGTPISYSVHGTTVTSDPDPRTCSYIHLDLTTEQLGQTGRYNCWGFTFIPRRYWIDGSTSVDNIIADNCVAVPDGSVRVGDVIRYRDDVGVTTHTGRVWETDGAGHATLVRSKWGSLAEYIHKPLDAPSIYGTNLAYFRQVAPLLGVADLWIRDSPMDNGEQYSDAPWWVSPDILVDVPPYDGVPDINPVFAAVNRVWARIANRSDLDATNVYVRYYWADPSLGLPPSGWNLVPATSAHPNPAGPISVPASSIVDAPYVEWTPAAAPAHQCLLAIAYINDDPRDSSNLDPLVYPFDIPWDNSIGQRNVHVVHARREMNYHFTIGAGSPFPRRMRERDISIEATLTHAPRIAILGQPGRVAPLDVTLTLDGAKKAKLVPCSPSQRRDSFGCAEGRSEKAVARGSLRSLSSSGRKHRRLRVDISVPKSAKADAIYYLHLVQKTGQTVCGGYTFAIVVE